MSLQDVVLLIGVRAASYLLVCIGFAIVFGSAGILNLSHGAFFVVAAYLAWAAGPGGAGLGAPAAWLLSVAGTAALGYLFFRVFLRLEARRPERCMVLCLSANLVIMETLKLAAGTRAIPVPRLVEGVTQLGALRVSNQQLLAVPIAVLAACICAFILRRTGVGRAIRAMAQDRGRAEALGLRPEVYAGGAFVGSVVLVAIAAAVVTPDQVIGPSSWVGPLVKSFAVVVAGGIRGIPAIAVASVSLAGAEVVTAVTISEGASEYVGLAAVLAGTLVRGYIPAQGQLR